MPPVADLPGYGFGGNWPVCTSARIRWRPVLFGASDDIDRWNRQAGELMHEKQACERPCHGKQSSAYVKHYGADAYACGRL